MKATPNAPKARTSRPAARALLPILAGVALSCSGPAASSSLTLTSATPTTISARGGETLTLHGSGFDASLSVRLGGDAALAPTIVSESEARVETPPLFAGKATVTLEASDGRRAALQDGVDVLALDLRFVEAPAYALPSREEALRGAAMEDFDGDGDVDLLTCAAAAPCRFLENDGHGNFTDTSAAAGEVDAGAGGGGGGTLGPPPNADPHFPPAVPDTRALTTADFDGDGDVDLLLGLGDGGPFVVYRNGGDATFTEAGLGAAPVGAGEATAVAAGDLDGDGRPDVVIAEATAEGTILRIYFETGLGGTIQFTRAPDESLPAPDGAIAAIALADVDGDADLDLVAATPGAADGVALHVVKNEHGAFDGAPMALPGAGGAVTALAAGDVTGDGAVDLVAATEGQDRLLVNDGTGHFFDATEGGMPLDASKGRSVALVDLDRDRDLDLVIGNDGAETRLYLGDGAGRFFDHTPLLPILTDHTAFVAAADVENDGDQDLVIATVNPGSSHLYLSVEPRDDAR